VAKSFAAPLTKAATIISSAQFAANVRMLMMHDSNAMTMAIHTLGLKN
jgi:hypothetical protein